MRKERHQMSTGTDDNAYLIENELTLTEQYILTKHQDLQRGIIRVNNLFDNQIQKALRKSSVG